MLKFIIPDEEEYNKLSKEHQALYDEDGAGRWVLKVEGAVPKKQLDDFRNTNIELRKKVEAFGDITPEEAKELKSKKGEFEAGNDPKKVEELVERRVADMKKTHETELQTLRDENGKLKTKNAQTIIDAALLEAGTKAGLRPTAQQDLIARGRVVFSLAEDGETIQAVDSQGQPVYGDAGDKLTPDSWIRKISKEASHLFGDSSGGGASPPGGGKPPGNTSKGNPWMKDSWNLTEQGRLIREDREKARQLAHAAGKEL